MNFILYVVITLQGLFILVYNYRCLFESGNHSGLIKLITYSTLGFACLMFVWRQLIAQKIAKGRKLLLISIIIALFTFINIFTFNQLNIMVDHQEWIHRGSPIKPFGLK